MSGRYLDEASHYGTPGAPDRVRRRLDRMCRPKNRPISTSCLIMRRELMRRVLRNITLAERKG